MESKVKVTLTLSYLESQHISLIQRSLYPGATSLQCWGLGEGNTIKSTW